MIPARIARRPVETPPRRGRRTPRLAYLAGAALATLAALAAGAHVAALSRAALAARLATLESQTVATQARIVQLRRLLANVPPATAIPTTPALAIPQVLTYYELTLPRRTDVTLAGFTFTPTQTQGGLAPLPAVRLAGGVTLVAYPVSATVTGREGPVLRYLAQLTTGPWLVTVTSVRFMQLSPAATVADCTYDVDLAVASGHG